MRFFTPLAAALGLSLLGGCGSGSHSTSAINLTGRWVRPVTIVGSSLSMTLQESSSQVSGTGNYAIEAGRSGTLQVKGSTSSSNVNLTLTYDSGTIYTFTGQRTDPTHLSGTLQTTGFPGDPTSFVKQ